MELIPGTTQVTADAIVGPTGVPIRVYNVQMLSGGTASTVTLRNGKAAGDTAWIQLDGVINKTVSIDWSHGVRFPNGLFVDCDANTTSVTVTWASEF